ncbi:hypothetical protein Tcan_06258, partial [Toxocara canis]
LSRYPPTPTIERISEATGLQVAEVRRWFANRRREERGQLKGIKIQELVHLVSSASSSSNLQNADAEEFSKVVID